MKVDPEDADSIRAQMTPEEGRVRDWLFVNGEQVRLFVALAGVFCGVLWLYWYILGGGQSVIATVLLAGGGIRFAVWRLVNRQLWEYERRGWKKDLRSPRVEKMKSRLRSDFGYLF
jgi:hypothetical protein